jgi:tetratricopeptide (TPR) repeat protein
LSATEIAKARALIDVGREDEAASLLAQTLAGDEGNQEAWCLLGLAHVRRGRHVPAVECTRRAIELGPDLEWPHRLASVAELGLGNVPRAIAAARESVRLAPHLAAAHAQLGCALGKGDRGMHQEAAREAERAVTLAPADAGILVMAGNAALSMRWDWLAEQRFANALALDPTRTDALNNLSLVRLRGGSPVAAAAGFSKAAALDPARDLHRRNLDAATSHALVYASMALAVPAVVDGGSVVAGTAVLVAMAIAACVYAVRARRAIGRQAWRYVRRLPFSNGRVGWNALVVAAQGGCLIAVPFAGQGPAGFALIAGLGTLFWFVVRRASAR